MGVVRHHEIVEKIDRKSTETVFRKFDEPAGLCAITIAPLGACRDGTSYPDSTYVSHFCRRTNLVGLRSKAADTLAMLSRVRTVCFLLEGSLFAADAVALNC